MCRIIKPSYFAIGLRLTFLLVFTVFLHGCAVTEHVQVKQPPIPAYPEEQIERHNFTIARGEGIVGRLVSLRLEDGDTLPDIARHFSLGINEVSAANPGVDVWVPAAGTRILMPLYFILPDAPQKGIVINLASMRLFHYQEDRRAAFVSTYPVGIGTEERPSPEGQMYVAQKTVRPTWHVPASIAEKYRKKGDPLPASVPPGPLNPLGEYALYLSKSGYLIHGTNKPASIGLRATNGCIRLYPEDVKKLYAQTPIKTPVHIVNQPYLVAERNGVVYIEIHTPVEDTNDDELAKMYVKLRTIQRKSGRSLDWEKVKTVLAEARGIPVPISTLPGKTSEGVDDVIAVRHPEKLYGSPEIPELTATGWYVLAADSRDETDAKRLTAIVNHQGPPIPARIMAKNDHYRVLTGPFEDMSAANNAIKRLRIDLGVEGLLIKPVQSR